MTHLHAAFCFFLKKLALTSYWYMRSYSRLDTDVLPCFKLFYVATISED